MVFVAEPRGLSRSSTSSSQSTSTDSDTLAPETFASVTSPCPTCGRAINCLGAEIGEFEADGRGYCSQNCKWSAVLGGPRKHKKARKRAARAARFRDRIQVNLADLDKEPEPGENSADADDDARKDATQDEYVFPFGLTFTS